MLELFLTIGNGPLLCYGESVRENSPVGTWERWKREYTRMGEVKSAHTTSTDNSKISESFFVGRMETF
jgi:hypothetical protein